MKLAISTEFFFPFVNRFAKIVFLFLLWIENESNAVDTDLRAVAGKEKETVVDFAANDFASKQIASVVDKN